jgi:hypothetical protein
MIKSNVMESPKLKIGSLTPAFDKWWREGRSMFLVGEAEHTEAIMHALLGDPVEYQVDARHGLAMHTVLKTILRLDPDYILIGEIRDEASARVAIDAAATSAAKTPARF